MPANGNVATFEPSEVSKLNRLAKVLRIGVPNFPESSLGYFNAIDYVPVICACYFYRGAGSVLYLTPYSFTNLNTSDGNTITFACVTFENWVELKVYFSYDNDTGEIGDFERAIWSIK